MLLILGLFCTFRNTIAMNHELFLMMKYATVGVANTAITIIVFFLLRKIGMGIDGANFIAYAAGILNSFLCNKLWVFRSRGKNWRKEAFWFLFGTSLCWFLQWLSLKGLLLFVSETIAFFIGMCIYTAANYLFNRLITFK